MKKLILLGVLALAGCATIDWNAVPPIYACENLEEFGCPNSNFEHPAKDIPKTPA